MFTRKTLFILLVILLLPAMAFADSIPYTGFTEHGVIPDMKFKRLDTRDGLSNSQVNCVLRDSRGYMWVATSFGLCRYDGYRCRNYYSYEHDTLTLRNNQVNRVMEAFDGKLWLDHGMTYSVYDPVKEQVDRSPSIWLAKQGVKGGIEMLHIDSKKNFWIKTYDDGFVFFDPKNKRIKRLNFGYGKNLFPKEFGIKSFTEMPEGMLMVSNQGDQICVNGEKGVVVWTDHIVKNELNLYADYKSYLAPDGMRWIISNSTKTYIYDTHDKRWYRTLTEMLRAKGLSGVPDDIVVWDACYDTKGYLWVATDHLGVLVVDFKNKEWRQFSHVKGDDTSLPDITTKRLYLDQLGRMWIATYKNGLAMNADAMSSFSSLPLGDINAVVEDDDGYYWLGMNSGGVKKVNPQTFEVVAEYKKGEMGTPSDIIVCCYKDREGTLWFGTWEGGLLRFRNGQWTNWRVGMPGCALTTNNVWGITEDYCGNIWLGVLGGGVVRIDKRTGRQRAFNDQNSKLKTVWTNGIQRAPNEWLLIANVEYCSLINPQNMKVVNLTMPHDENSFTVSTTSVQMLWGKNGLIWQASASGLSVYDRKRGQFQLLDMRSGFHGSSVSSIIEDEGGAVWAATDHGISKVTPQQEADGHWIFSVRSFNDRDGLQPGPFNQRSMCMTRKGLLLIGGQDGLDVIDTRNLKAVDRKERPVFSGLLIFDEDVSVGQELHGRVVLDEALDICRELSLKFDDQFTIQLASTDGSIHNGKRFVYKLEGFNENWVKTSELNPNITYNSLRAGDYTLRVRILNDDGTFGEEEATLEITIRPSFWRTRWMILLYMMLIVGMAFVWRKWYMKRQEYRMDVETMRRELEKQQWMNEMRLKIANDHANSRSASKPEPEVVHLDIVTEDLVFFTRHICEHYESPDPSKKVKVSFLSSVNQLTADFDEAKLKEVFMILFRNSISFTPYAPLISVGVARTSDNKAQIQVADNGIGIKDEYKEHAFDPMVNGEGIGLDYVMSIIDAHGGTIRIEDNPGGGTIFFITLPAQPEIEEAVVMDDE